MTTTDRLDAIEARANAATTGHQPCRDDGAMYCGWATDVSVSDGCGYAWPCPTVTRSRDDLALVAALRGVMEVHAPEFSPDYAGWWRCRECGLRLTDEAPDCPTVATITAALTEVTA